MCLLSLLRPPRRSPLFPYTTLFRSRRAGRGGRRAPAPRSCCPPPRRAPRAWAWSRRARRNLPIGLRGGQARSEEHTSELQSLRHLVCRLLLEEKKTDTPHYPPTAVA